MSSAVSVIIPAFNAARFLSQALDSILPQLAPGDDIVLVNDGSTDDTAAVAARYRHRIRYFEQPRAGAAAARNLGIRRSHGEWLAFLDADDLWAPGKLALQRQAVSSGDPVDMVFGQVVQFHSPAARALEMPSVPEAGRPLPGYLPGALLVSRTAMTSVGSFDESLRVGEFIDWCTRARDCGLREHMLPGIVLYRRIHGENQGIVDRSRYGPDYLRVVRKTLRRRRQHA